MRFCIILGAMKAGTTSLFNYLSQHPQVAASKEKEPSFFSHHYDKGLEHYLRLWRQQDVETKVLMEASTNYTKYPSFSCSSQSLLDFSQQYNADMKFIYIMRNPVDRILSQYTYSFARWTDASLADSIEQGYIVAVSRYASQLEPYYTKFDKDRFLLLDFDDLTKRPKDLLRQVCTFLSIDGDFSFADLNEIHNKSKGQIITRPIETTYKKYPLTQSLSKLFPKSFKKLLLKQLFRKRISGNFEFTEEQRQYIYQALKDDMALLRQKHGVDVAKWGF